MEAILAVKNGNFEELTDMVQKVVQGFTFFHTVSQGGVSLLHWACQSPKNSVDIARLLLKNEIIEVTAIDQNGATALHWACEAGNLGVARVLVDEYQIDVNTKDHADETALHWATLKGVPECVDYLISKNALPNEQDEQGNTPLHSAAINNNVECVALLLGKAAVDPTVLNQSKKKPEQLATSPEVKKLFQSEEDVRSVLEKFEKKQISGAQSAPTSTQGQPPAASTISNSPASQPASEATLNNNTPVISKQTPTINEMLAASSPNFSQELIDLKTENQKLKQKISELEQENRFLNEECNENGLENLQLKQELASLKENNSQSEGLIFSTPKSPSSPSEDQDQKIKDLNNKIEQLLLDKEHLQHKNKELEETIQRGAPEPSRAAATIDPSLEIENKKYLQELEEKTRYLEQQYKQSKEQSEEFIRDLEDKLRKFEQAEKTPSIQVPSEAIDPKLVIALELKNKQLVIENKIILQRLKQIAELTQLPSPDSPQALMNTAAETNPNNNNFNYNSHTNSQKKTIMSNLNNNNSNSTPLSPVDTSSMSPIFVSPPTLLEASAVKPLPQTIPTLSQPISPLAQQSQPISPPAQQSQPISSPAQQSQPISPPSQMAIAPANEKKD